MNLLNVPSTDFVFAHKTLPVDRLKELQEDIDKLRREGKLSNHKTYRSYLENKKFEVPESLPNARSLIVIAYFTKLMLVNFHLNGKKYEVMLSPQYYSSGLTEEVLSSTILEKIVKEPGFKIEKANQLHLKLLAVRSGLGRYGRNNLCYVKGMGSLLKLSAYFTDYQFEENNWNEIRMMEVCEDCKICMSHCPTKCITKENFVIDAGKCLTLYNEIKGVFPGWIYPDAHNALMGCLKCQLHCPANREVIKSKGRFEDITEEETKTILKGTPDGKVLSTLSSKLRNFPPATSKDLFPIFTRNLRVLLNLKTEQHS